MIKIIAAANLAWRSHRPYDDVSQWVAGSLLDTLRRAGYQVESTTETETVGRRRTEWVLRKDDRSAFLFLVSVFLWWMNGSTYRVVLDVCVLDDGRTELLVAGDIPRSIAKILRQLADASVTSG